MIKSRGHCFAVCAAAMVSLTIQAGASSLHSQAVVNPPLPASEASIRAEFDSPMTDRKFRAAVSNRPQHFEMEEMGRVVRNGKLILLKDLKRGESITLYLKTGSPSVVMHLEAE